MTRTLNSKTTGMRRTIVKTLQWKKAKQAAQDAAHGVTRAGEGVVKAGVVRNGSGAVWQWAKARNAAVSGHRKAVPGALMYRRGPRSGALLARAWERSREASLSRLKRWPIGFDRA